MGLVLIASAAIYTSADEKRAWEILGRDTVGKGSYVVRPMVPPAFGVRQVAGPEMPGLGTIACEYKQEYEKVPNGSDRIVVLRGYCEGGIQLIITGVDLNH